MLALQLTESAQEDIRNIASYIATESYEKYAIDFGHKIKKTFELLCHSPNIGAARERSGEGVKLHAMGKINIIYRVSNQNLQVLRVHHSKLDSCKLSFD